MRLPSITGSNFLRMGEAAAAEESGIPQHIGLRRRCGAKQLEQGYRTLRDRDFARRVVVFAVALASRQVGGVGRSALFDSSFEARKCSGTSSALIALGTVPLCPMSSSNCLATSPNIVMFA